MAGMNFFTDNDQDHSTHGSPLVAAAVARSRTGCGAAPGSAGFCGECGTPANG